MQLRKFLLVCCLLLYCQSVSSQEYTDAPDDPDNLEIDTQYITEGLVSGTDFAGPNCTFRPSGHGVWGQGYAGYTNRNSDGYIGACPQVSQDGTMRFSWSRNGGYVTATIDENSINETVQAYAAAFANSGIDVDGYSYSWYIKNADVGNANNSAAQGPYDPKTQDSLTIKIDFLDSSGEAEYTQTYDYSEAYLQWTPKSGTVLFDDPIQSDAVDRIVITVDGYDSGYWAGYFGPEVKDFSFKIIFTVNQLPSNCDSDPLSSPTCPGYADAFNVSVGLPTLQETIDEIESDVIEDSFSFNDGTESFQEDGTQSISQIEAGIISIEDDTFALEDTEIIIDDGTTNDTYQNDGQITDDGQDFTGADDNVLADETGQITDVIEEIIVIEETIIEEVIEEVIVEELEIIEDVPLDVVEETIIEETIIEEADEISSATGAPKKISVNPVAIAREAASLGTAAATAATNQASLSASIASQNDTLFSQSMSEQSNLSNNTLGTGAIGQPLIQSFGQPQDTIMFGNQNTQSGNVFGNQNTQSGNVFGNQDTNTFGNQDTQSGNMYGNQDTQNSYGLDNNNEYALNSEDAFTENSDASFSQQDFNSNFNVVGLTDFNVVGLVVEVSVESFDKELIKDAVSNVVNSILQQNKIDMAAEEEEEAETGLTTSEEDELVEAAIAGDTGEDAQAALLGYNPSFRAYQTPQMTDSTFYTPKDIYPDQANVDNPNGRFFNGASDELHRKMVRQQYNK